MVVVPARGWGVGLELQGNASVSYKRQPQRGNLPLPCCVFGGWLVGVVDEDEGYTTYIPDSPPSLPPTVADVKVDVRCGQPPSARVVLRA